MADSSTDVMCCNNHWRMPVFNLYSPRWDVSELKPAVTVTTSHLEEHKNEVQKVQSTSADETGSKKKKKR